MSYYSRVRKTVEEIFSGFGPIYSKRAYRIRANSFYKLYNTLFPHSHNPTKNVATIPNRPILLKSKLSQAFRFLQVV